LDKPPKTLNRQRLEKRLSESAQTVMLIKKLTAQGQSVAVYFYNLSAHTHVGDMPDLDFAL
jgi:hypothetical protein